MAKHLEELWVEHDLLTNYAISSYGRVVNVNTGRELKASPDKNGYLRVALYHKGVRHDVFVHRLVAMVFFINYRDGIEVRHKNGILSDNSVLNLTLGGNCRKAVTDVQASSEAEGA